MYFIVARLAGSNPAAQAECDLLSQKILHGEPRRTAPTHVYARPEENGMELVLFVAAATLESAEAGAQDALQQALESSGLALTIASCGAGLFIPGAEAQLDLDP